MKCMHRIDHQIMLKRSIKQGCIQKTFRLKSIMICISLLKLLLRSTGYRQRMTQNQSNGPIRDKRKGGNRRSLYQMRSYTCVILEYQFKLFSASYVIIRCEIWVPATLFFNSSPKSLYHQQIDPCTHKDHLGTTNLQHNDNILQHIIDLLDQGWKKNSRGTT